MRKGQELVIKRAVKENLTDSQMSALSREDLTIDQLNGLFNLFYMIPDWPVDDAVEKIKGCTRKEANHFGSKFFIFGYGASYPRMTYTEIMSMPEEFRNNPECLPKSLWTDIKQPKDNPLTLPEFVNILIDTFGIEDALFLGKNQPSPILLYIEELDYTLHKYDDTKQIAFDFAMYYAKVWLAVIKNIMENYREEYRAYRKEIFDKHMSSINKMLDERKKRYLKDNRLFIEILERECGDDPSFSYAGWFAAEHFGMFMGLKECYINKVDPKTVAKYVCKEETCEYEDPIDLFTNDVRKLKKTYETANWGSKEQEEAVKEIIKNGIVTGKVSVRATRAKIMKSPKLLAGDHEVYSALRIVISKAFEYYFTSRYDLDEYKRAHGYSKVMPHGFSYKTDRMYVIFPNGDVFVDRQGMRFAPAMCKDFIRDIQACGGKKFMNQILSFTAYKDSDVLKDVVREFNEKGEGILFPSINWNSCIGMHNKNDLMRSLYKRGQDIDWNRLGICRGYAYMNTRPYVDDKSTEILKNAIYTGQIKGTHAKSARGKLIAIDVVSEFLEHTIQESEWSKKNHINSQIEIRDYTTGASKAGIKLNMHQKSLRKLMDKNTELAVMNENKTTPVIKIPKNSKFLALRNMLPDNFEWIKTKRRIIEEGRRMNHCVASYAEYVNKDDCAIYHLIYDDIPYTIEFKERRHGEYYVNQIQSRSDRGAPSEVVKYVKNCIKKETKADISLSFA